MDCLQLYRIPNQLQPKTDKEKMDDKIHGSSCNLGRIKKHNLKSIRMTLIIESDALEIINILNDKEEELS